MEKLNEMLAKGAGRLITTQKQYQADALAVWAIVQVQDAAAGKQSDALQSAFDAIEQAQRAIVPSAQNKKAAAAYFMRLVRNVAAIDILGNGKTLSKETARQITDFWTDAEILNGFNAASPNIQKALRLMLTYWQNDKEGGFINAPEPQRAAAQAGNYGAYISRLMEKPQPASLHIMSLEDRERLKRYCFPSYIESKGKGEPNFDADEQEIYKHLCRPRGKKAAVRLIYCIFDKHVHPRDKKAGGGPLTWKDWCKMWGDAYGVKLPKYESTTL